MNSFFPPIFLSAEMESLDHVVRFTKKVRALRPAPWNFKQE